MITFKQFLLSEMALSKVTLNKYPERVQTLVKKLVNKEPFVLLGHDTPTEIIEPDPNWLQQLITNGKVETTFIPTKNGNKMQLSTLQKTQEFGGLGFHRERKERVQIGELNNKIQELGNGAPIKIKVGDNIYENCIGVQKTSGNYPKSDISIVNTNNQEIVFMSHKDNLRGRPDPKGFQRWSGIVDYANEQYPEVLKFVNDVKLRLKEANSYNENGEFVMLPGTFKRAIQDETLKYKSCFGKNYGSDRYGVDNVNCILQGNVSLTPEKDYFVLSSDRIWLSGELPGTREGEEGYDPTLTVYKSGGPTRFDQKVRNAIFCIYPKDGRKGLYI
jgi:hypothetical protein